MDTIIEHHFLKKVYYFITVPQVITQNTCICVNYHLSQEKECSQQSKSYPGTLLNH